MWITLLALSAQPITIDWKAFALSSLQTPSPIITLNFSEPEQVFDGPIEISIDEVSLIFLPLPTNSSSIRRYQAINTFDPFDYMQRDENKAVIKLTTQGLVLEEVFSMQQFAPAYLDLVARGSGNLGVDQHDTQQDRWIKISQFVLKENWFELLSRHYNDQIHRNDLGPHWAKDNGSTWLSRLVSSVDPKSQTQESRKRYREVTRRLRFDLKRVKIRRTDRLAYERLIRALEKKLLTR